MADQRFKTWAITRRADDRVRLEHNTAGAELERSLTADYEDDGYYDPEQEIVETLRGPDDIRDLAEARARCYFSSGSGSPTLTRS